MKKYVRDMTEPELRELGRGIGKWIENALPLAQPPLGRCNFILIYTDTIDPGIGQYLANCVRADAIKLLRETADRLERQEDVTR